ncbi:MAG: carboxypeptidase-like regulatory domain-containing protein [Bacteroidota bacterium]
MADIIIRMITFKRNIILLTALLWQTTLLAQVIEYHGLVVDKNQTPIPYANIYINEGKVGTHSNEAGEFVLKVSDPSVKDSLHVTAIGFKSAHYLLSSIDSGRMIISLSQQVAILDNVVITPTKDSLGIIVKKAIAAIPKNYPKKKYYIDGFYRELVMRDSTYVRLLEAAVGFQDRGFDMPPDNIRARVLAVRKSEDYINYSLYTKLHKIMYGEKNNLYETFKYDQIRGFNKEGFKYLESLLSNRYEFFLDTIKILDEKKIYVINYGPIDMQWKAPKGIFTKGKIYISEKDLAIVRVDRDYIADGKKWENLKNLAFNKTWLKKSTVVYRKIENKYYLSYIKWLSWVGGAWKTENEQGEKTTQFYNNSLYVNTIYTSKKDYDKIRKRESIERDVDLYAKEYDYDPDFWKDYNTVLINPLYKKAVKDLERNQPLDEQFENNRK